MKTKLLILLTVFALTTQAQQNTMLIELTGRTYVRQHYENMMNVKYFQQHTDIEIVSYNRGHDDPFGQAFDSPRRLMYYYPNGGWGDPYLIINGSIYEIPHTVIDTIEYVRQLIASHYQDEHLITFDIGGSYQPYGGFMAYIVRYKINERIDEDYIVHMVLTEDIEYGWYEGDSIYGVTRKMLPSYQGVTKTDIEGFNYEYGYNFLIPNEWHNVRLVMFAQTENGTIIGCKAMYIKDLNYLGVDSYDLTDNSLIIYPNPVTNIVHFKGVYSQVWVYNSLGQIVLETAHKQANMSQFQSGIYYVKTNTGIVKKIVKR